MSWESDKIRQSFFDFFKEKDHEIAPSSPMVLKDDPTLMFTNAGMNQFKDLFLGDAKAKYQRVANSQKCLRVSGKHNDLEEVGVDTYHHTMFEMLGNWSFGDYFKNEATEWAWELLTKVYKIDPELLYVTIFGGDPDGGIERDVEAEEAWKRIVPEDRILEYGKSDNFWEMGETGPCGPCSEIHIDLRSAEDKQQQDGAALVNKGHPLVIELWNLVFIEFNRTGKGLEPLPRKHVDTGMGFERLCMVLQGKTSNYDTDAFQPLINELEKLCGKKKGEDEQADVALRVVADHVRAVSFSIAEGQLPSNTGAGYVIRRILRRAIRYGYSFLEMKEPFIHNLVGVLVGQLGGFFPELKAQQELIQKVINEEEENFLKTLERGLERFEKELERVPPSKFKVGIPFFEGQAAFELNDTYGFPVDLTNLIAKEHGYAGVDMGDYNRCLKEQKDRSRAATAVKVEDWIELIQDDVEEFVGFDFLQTDVKITRYRKVTTKGKEMYQLVFNITPFYAEGGGQVGDTGHIEAEGEKTEIIGTKKENNLILHYANGLPANLKTSFKAVVDEQKRQQTACNHSATHLLHQVLQEVLGDHIEQKGSLVDPGHLRFDFSHFQKLTEEEMTNVETLVNDRIRVNISRDEKRDIPFQKAKEMGAVALFGEKYGDLVRVIRFGESVELCGGIHVEGTGQIGLFKITAESAVAAGVRRIEAITGGKAQAFIDDQLKELAGLKKLLKTNNVTKAVNDLLKLNTELSKQTRSVKKEGAKSLKEDLMKEARQVNGTNYIAARVDADNDTIKDLAFQLKKEMDNLFLVLGAENDNKATLTVAISENLVEEKGLNAVEIIKSLATEIQGGGGGQPFFATAGGKNPAGIENALKKSEEYLN